MKRTCQEILDTLRTKQYETAGYYSTPYNFSSQFNFLPSYILPEVGQVLLETQADFKDNKKTGEQIKKERKDKLIGIGVNSAAGLLSTIGNVNHYQNSLQRQRELDVPNYTPVASDNRYNSSITDSYQQYQSGGVIDEVNNQQLYDIKNYNQVGGIMPKDILGYSRNSSFQNEPFIDIHSPNISLQNTDIPLKGVADTGEKKIMYPGNDYHFKGANVVREIPLYQSGVNIQTLGNISFDSNALVDKGQYLIAKDVNTGNDYGIVKNNNGSFDFYNSTQANQNNNLDPLQVVAKVPYDYQKTKNYITSLSELNTSSFPKRAELIATDYVKIQQKSKDDRKKRNETNPEYLKALQDLDIAFSSGNDQAINAATAKVGKLEGDLTPAHLDCLGSSCMYSDRYFKKDYGLVGMGKIKERLIPYTNQNDAGMAAWNIFGAFKKDNPSQIDYSQEFYEKTGKYKDLPQDVKNKIVVGSNIGFTDGNQRSGINSEQGIVDTRHHTIVIGFDKDKTPIIYDYGEAKRLDDPKYGYNIGAIATPTEYRNANITSDIYNQNPISYETSLKKYSTKDNTDTKATNEMSKSLVDNRNMIKAKLDLNDYDYNRLSSYLLGISQQETSGYNLPSKINDFFASAKSNPSLGALQIKLENVKQLVDKYDLPKEYATKSALKDPYKTAIIGMFMAKDIDDSKEKFYQRGKTPQVNVQISKPILNVPVLNKIRYNSTIDTQGNSELTDAEKFFYSWNSPNKLKTGQAQGNSEYVKNNKKNLENVKIEFQNGGNFNPNIYGKLNDFTDPTLLAKGVRFNEVYSNSGSPKINWINGRDYYSDSDNTINISNSNNLLTELPHAYQNSRRMFDDKVYSDSNEIPLNHSTNQFKPNPYYNADSDRRERDFKNLEKYWETEKLHPANKKLGLSFIGDAATRSKILDSWLYDTEGTAEYEAHRQIEPSMRNYIETGNYQSGGKYQNYNYKYQVGDQVEEKTPYSGYENIDEDATGQYNYLDYSEDEKQREQESDDFWKQVNDENEEMFSIAEDVKEQIRTRSRDREINLDIPETFQRNDGSTYSQRNLNAGNLKYAPWMQKYGAVKGDYAPENDNTYFAKFPDWHSSLAAQRELLQSKNYRDLSVPQALNRYAAGTYQNQKFLNLFGNKKVGQLNPQELALLQKEIVRHEDGKTFKQIYGHQVGGYNQTGKLVQVNDGNKSYTVTTDSPEYKSLYNSGKLMSSDGTTYSAPQMNTVNINANAPSWLNDKKKLESQYSKDWWIDNKMPKMSRSLGVNANTFSDQNNEDYNNFIMQQVSDNLIARTPQKDQSRVDYLNKFSNKEQSIAQEYNPKLKPSLYTETVRGLQSLTETNLLQAYQNIINNSNYTKKEKEELLLSHATNPNLSIASDAASILSILAVPSKVVQSTYKPNYSITDALSGRQNNASIGEDIITDPLNLLGVGLFNKGKQVSKVGEILNNVAKEEPLYHEISSLSDIKIDPNKGYRVIGLDALDDILANKIIRSKIANPNAVETEKNVVKGINLGSRPTAYPSFSQGSISESYVKGLPSYAIIETEHPIKASTLGRHGKGSTFFPVDEQGNFLKEMPINTSKIYRYAPKVDVEKNLKDLEYAKDYFTKYGYNIPKNLNEIAQSSEETDKVIKGLVDQHNTFARGVSTNWEQLPDVVKNNLTKQGIDWKNNPQAAAEYMATVIPPETGYGRVDLKKGEHALYTSNSLPTAEGYTYGDGYIVKVKKPTDYTSSNRTEWVDKNQVKYQDKNAEWYNRIGLDNNNPLEHPGILKTESQSVGKINKTQFQISPQTYIDDLADGQVIDKDLFKTKLYDIHNTQRDLMMEDKLKLAQEYTVERNKIVENNKYESLQDNPELQELNNNYKSNTYTLEKEYSVKKQNLIDQIIKEHVPDINNLTYPINRYAHYLHKGNPGDKLFEPVESIRITPDKFINKSRAHTGEYTKGLSAATVAGIMAKINSEK